jgi:hypothetical protein
MLLDILHKPSSADRAEISDECISKHPCLSTTFLPSVLLSMKHWLREVSDRKHELFRGQELVGTLLPLMLSAQ